MLVYGKYECFAMQMLYVCVLCPSCDSLGQRTPPCRTPVLNLRCKDV